jgi:CspA family cold shock protein
MMRKDYGLADLQQMDINPLAGDPNKLTQDDAPLLSVVPAATELRFVDAQIAYPFIRAQLILFQAIAMYGRTLARAGKRLPYMRDEVIDENKALAVQSGPGAIFKPDEKFKKDNGGRGYSYHDKGQPERATTAILMIIEGLLLPYLRELGCQYWELAPILLGAELRRRGRQCFANYAEYQKYLHYTYTERFAVVFQQQAEQLLASPRLDYITDYNQRTYNDLANTIELEWSDKLKPRPRRNGRVRWYSAKKQEGFLRTEDNEEYHVEQRDMEGTDCLEEGQLVTFEVQERNKRAIRVRVEAQERFTGYVVRFDETKGFGFIKVEGQGEAYVHRSNVMEGRKLVVGEIVSLEIVKEPKGLCAMRVKIQAQPLQQGQVKYFNREKHFGYIALADGAEIFFHQDDVVDSSALSPGQRVNFRTGQSTKGPRAIHVQIASQEK